ncbi:6-phosphogluconolactonase [Lewinellaceae bacterium SD302]|nr:6-phosphogluconolactonase [Lewinellaceae bacterium SD302]
MQPKLHIYPDNPAVARAFADYLTEKLADHPGDFHLALSGGSTPKLLFQLLAKDYSDKIEWSKLHLYWGDERMVPHDDPESNYGEAKALLLDKVDIPATNIHPVPTGLEADKAATAYGLVLEHSLAQRGKSVTFDLVMLGMGGDGHTASIFPHQMELLTDEATCGVAEHPESGQLRVTLNGPVINAANEICFLVTGAGKAEKVALILGEGEGYDQYPAAHVKPVSGHVHWFLDEAAAAGLPKVH